MAEFCECKFNWYQTQSEVVICVLRRDQRLDACHLRFASARPVAGDVAPASAHDDDVGGEKRQLVKLFVDETLVFSTFLYGGVSADAATLKCTPSKIELHLPKTISDAWPQLSALAAERVSDADDDEGEENKENAGDAVALRTTKKERPNWDKIGKEAEEEELENSDPTVRLFKKIYMGADEDARRAMMKSMYESGGTVMNTNWSEVGKKRIGMYNGRTDDHDDNGEDDEGGRAFNGHHHHAHDDDDDEDCEVLENGDSGGAKIEELDDTQSESSDHNRATGDEEDELATV